MPITSLRHVNGIHVACPNKARHVGSNSINNVGPDAHYLAMSLRRCEMEGVVPWADHIQAIHSWHPMLRSMKRLGQSGNNTSYG